MVLIPAIFNTRVGQRANDCLTTVIANVCLIFVQDKNNFPSLSLKRWISILICFICYFSFDLSLCVQGTSQWNLIRGT